MGDTANLPPFDAVEIPAWVVVNGERYTLLAGVCGHCSCTFFYPRHPEFNPRHCPYCGQGFTYFHDGTDGDLKDLLNRPLQ